jgi:plasmid maintenance system killer protein
MIVSFRSPELAKAWQYGEALPYKTLIAERVFDTLDVIDAASSPRDADFVGFRFDEWTEGSQRRFGVMVSDHWLISYGWSDGHAIDVDLERIE